VKVAVIRKGAIPMTKHILMLTTVTFALISGAIAASAQEDSDDAALIRQWVQVQQNPGDEEDPGMTGRGMARHCMRQCITPSLNSVGAGLIPTSSSNGAAA
jgi:hypothetical protein